MKVRRITGWGVGAFAALLPVCAAAQSLGAGDLAARFPACALLHFSETGYAGLRGARERPEIATPRSLRALSQRALRAAPVLRTRNSLLLQWGQASSIEAAQVYGELADVMQENGFSAHQGVRWDDLQRLAAAAHSRAMQAGGTGRCVLFKWGNKQPDVFWVALSAEELGRIRALFSDAAFNRFRREFGARRWPHGLTDREAFELHALRLASFRFELNFEMLDRDRGDFAGNFRGVAGGTVCTDEAAIHEAFLRQVILAEGLLTRFDLARPAIFAHRRPQTRIAGPVGAVLGRVNSIYGLTDHFAPVLVRKGRPLTLVLDSWVDDGGLPPHISTYSDWMERGETRNLVPLFPDPVPGHDARLERRAIGASGAPVRPHHGNRAYRDLRTALLERYFDGHLPIPAPDPRHFGLRIEDGQWQGGATFGR